MAGSNWSTNNNRFNKRFEFRDFKSALSFVNEVGKLAEKCEHHPDISFGWGYVEIYLYTHSENAITDKDKDLAKLIDKITT